MTMQGAQNCEDCCPKNDRCYW